MVGKAQTSTRLLAAIALIVVVAGSTATLVVNWRMKASARDEALVKAMLILDLSLFFVLLLLAALGGGGLPGQALDI